MLGQTRQWCQPPVYPWPAGVPGFLHVLLYVCEVREPLLTRLLDQLETRCKRCPKAGEKLSTSLCSYFCDFTIGHRLIILCPILHNFGNVLFQTVYIVNYVEELRAKEARKNKRWRLIFWSIRRISSDLFSGQPFNHQTPPPQKKRWKVWHGPNSFVNNNFRHNKRTVITISPSCSSC